MKVLVIQSCPTLWDPMDCNLPGSSVHGISQARRLEWVAHPLPQEILPPGIQPGLPHCGQILHHLNPQGSLFMGSNKEKK